MEVDMTTTSSTFHPHDRGHHSGASMFDAFLLSDSLPTPTFPPSPVPTQLNVGVSPHAPSPNQQQQLSSFPSELVSTSLKRAAAVTTTSSGAIIRKKVVNLDEIERDILRGHPDLPVETKKRMVKAELKRLKHVETVRQSRVRKKNERKDLRKINEELEAELNQSLVQYQATHNCYAFDEDSWWDVQFKKFVHSIYEVRSLRRERSELKDKLMYYDTIGEQLERLQEDFQIPESMCARPSIGTIHFKPLTVDEAREIMLDSHEQALSFFKNMKWQTAAEHEQTNGWTQHQRIVPDGRVQFNFTKRITTIGAEELVEKSWQMYCDLNLYRGIYACVQRLEILQRINEDTLLIRRDLQEGSSSPIFRTIFLLFRIRLDNGYVICFRSHNPPICVDDDDDPNVQWMDMFYWLMVLDPPAPAPGLPRPFGCDVSFGGNLLNATSAQHATRWKYQIAMALLRWESNAVAPLFAMLG